MDFDEDDIPLPVMPCGHPLAARAVRYWNERLVTVCWACAIEGQARVLYGSASGETMGRASDGASRTGGRVTDTTRPRPLLYREAVHADPSD